MAFLFRSSKYNFPTQWTGAERAKAQEIFKAAVKWGVGSEKTYQFMRAEGVGYRKTDMLKDIARARAVEQSKSVTAYRKAEAWFEQTQIVREKTGIRTQKEAAAFMQKWKTESWEAIEEAQAATAMEAEGGCPSPPC